MCIYGRLATDQMATLKSVVRGGGGLWLNRFHFCFRGYFLAQLMVECFIMLYMCFKGLLSCVLNCLSHPTLKVVLVESTCQNHGDL